MEVSEYEHGTTERYDRGCHCPECKAARAAYVKHWRRGGVTNGTVRRVRDRAGGLTPQQAGMLGEAITRWAAQVATPEEIARSARLLPPEQLAKLRALLPDPGDQAETA